MEKKVKKYEKYVKTVSKKIPKQKLATKAITYGARQLIGGTYFDIANLIWSKTQGKVIKYAGNYAYKNFMKSKFARNQLNVVPLSIASLTLRSIVGYFVISRFRSGIYWLDFLISMIMTIIITLLSPAFYLSVQSHEEKFMAYTNSFVDNFMGPHGWEYIDGIKNRFLFIGGFFLLITLQLVEINSRMIQEFIIHTVITGYISDKLNQFINQKPRRLYYAIENFPDKYCVIYSPEYVKTVPKTSNTKNLVFRYMKPQHATLVKI